MGCVYDVIMPRLTVEFQGAQIHCSQAQLSDVLDKLKAHGSGDCLLAHAARASKVCLEASKPVGLVGAASRSVGTMLRAAPMRSILKQIAFDQDASLLAAMGWVASASDAHRHLTHSNIDRITDMFVTTMSSHGSGTADCGGVPGSEHVDTASSSDVGLCSAEGASGDTAQLKAALSEITTLRARVDALENSQLAHSDSGDEDWGAWFAEAECKDMRVDDPPVAATDASGSNTTGEHARGWLGSARVGAWADCDSCASKSDDTPDPPLAQREGACVGSEIISPIGPDATLVVGGLIECDLPTAGCDDDVSQYSGACESVVDKQDVTVDLEPGEWFKGKLKAWHSLRVELRKRSIEYTMKKKESVELDNVSFDTKGVAIEDIEDIHNIDLKGTPIYACFKYEDWVLLSWRYELHLLAHAFTADVADPDRPGIPVEQLPHYYSIYYKTKCDPGKLGADNLLEVFKLLKCPDVELATKGGNTMILCSSFDKELPLKVFIIGVESYRRDRIRRFDAGEESAQLHFPRV